MSLHILDAQKGKQTCLSILSSSSLVAPFSTGGTEVPFGAAPFSRFLTDGPPALFTSQHRTVQSAPPLTNIDDSALNASEYIDAVCPVIFLILLPEPISQMLIARSSPWVMLRQIKTKHIEHRLILPAVARCLPSGLKASVETVP